MDDMDYTREYVEALEYAYEQESRRVRRYRDEYLAKMEAETQKQVDKLWPGRRFARFGKALRRTVSDGMRHFWEGATAEEGYVLGVISGVAYCVIAIAIVVWLKGGFRW